VPGRKVECNKCSNQAVENFAGGNQFWYCRHCKDEVVVHDYAYLKAAKAKAEGCTQNQKFQFVTPNTAIGILKELYADDVAHLFPTYPFKVK